jgi:hypothetical protein
MGFYHNHFDPSIQYPCNFYIQECSTFVFAIVLCKPSVFLCCLVVVHCLLSLQCGLGVSSVSVLHPSSVCLLSAQYLLVVSSMSFVVHSLSVHCLFIVHSFSICFPVGVNSLSIYCSFCFHSIHVHVRVSSV